MHAEATNKPLAFQGDIPLPIEMGKYGTRTSAIQLETRSPYQPICDDVVTIFHEIRHLCDEYSGKVQWKMSEAERVTLSDNLWPVERRALTLMAKTDWADDQREISPSVSQAGAAAALIFVHYELRELEVNYRVYNKSVAKLQAALAETDDLLLTWTFAPEVLAWAMVTGAVVSWERPQRPWFIENLALVSQGLGIPDWESLKDVLRTFLYFESHRESQYVQVWEEVEAFLRDHQDFEQPLSSLLDVPPIRPP